MRLRRRRGANAIEFALIFPPLIAIMMGTMEYSWFLFNQIMLDSAAREGARAGARTPQDDSPGLVAENEAVAFWNSLNLPGSPTINSVVLNVQGEQYVRLDATMNYQALMGLAPVPTNVRARVAARMEDQP